MTFITFTSRSDAEICNSVNLRPSRESVIVCLHRMAFSFTQTGTQISSHSIMFYVFKLSTTVFCMGRDDMDSHKWRRQRLLISV